MLPVVGRLDVDGRSIPVWVHKASDYTDRHGRPRTLPHRHIGLSASAWSALHSVRAEAEALLIIEGAQSLKVAGAMASDLPAGNEVHISEELARLLGRRRFGRSPACLLSSARVCAPVKTVSRKSGHFSTMRAGMLTRALFELEVGDEVQLSLIPRRRPHPLRSLVQRAGLGPPRDSPWGVLVIVMGAAILSARALESLLEALLLLLLGAPGQPVRVERAHPGDDNADRRVIRLHSAVFPVLGISPGMQVFVHWERARTAAIALEDYQPHSPTIPKFLESRQAVGIRQSLPPEFPPHLVARVSLAVRQDLGMPANSVAVVRRRVRTLVMSQLNQLAIPVTGLFLAGLAIKGIRGWLFYSALIIVVLLGLLPLRRAAPPRGRWP